MKNTGVIALACLLFVSLNSFAALKFDSKVPADIKNQMTSDLKFIESIQGHQATALHNSVFGPTSGASYAKYFNSRVTAVGLSTCGQDFAVACVIPIMGSSRMWLTQNYIKNSHPQVARMMVVYHEARHTESKNRNWPHKVCPSPFVDSKGQALKSIWTGAELQGKPACDITALGAYGTSTVMLKNISMYCTNCNSKVKTDAALYADDQLHRIINRQALAQIQNDK